MCHSSLLHLTSVHSNAFGQPSSDHLTGPQNVFSYKFSGVKADTLYLARKKKM